MKITEPKTHTGKKPLAYYEVIGFADLEHPAIITDFYEFAGEAIRRCDKLVKDGFAVCAYVREEIVYRRTKTSEFSESGKIYECGEI